MVLCVHFIQMVLNHVESCSIIITIVNVILKINSRLLRIFYRLFATSCSEMRNTMDKKKKILIGAVLTVVILLAGVMAGFLIANAEKKEAVRKMLKTVR